MTTLFDVGERLQQIERIRGNQHQLYSNMNHFTIQTILTYMHNSPMNIDEIHGLQERITPDITRRKVTDILEDLVDRGYAKKLNRTDYLPTDLSKEVLEKEGVTKELLFPKP